MKHILLSLTKMFQLYTFFALLAIALAYNIKPIVKEGLPGFTDITTAPFIKIGESYYYIERKTRRNWFDAHDSCTEIGANLISFDTIEEWELVNQYLIAQKMNDMWYWTSGIELGKLKHIWLSNGQPILKSIWFPDQPSHPDTEFCDQMGFSPLYNPTYGLNDRSCSTTWFYICEAPQPKTAAFVVW